MSGTSKGDQERAFYDWLPAQLTGDMKADELLIGLVWSLCRSGSGTGLAMTPQSYSRTLPWPGTLAGKPLRELAEGIGSWEPFEAGVAMAAINASIIPDFSAFEHVVELPVGGGNLAVFDYFLPRIRGANIVVIGRYPGLDAYQQQYNLKVIERQPGANDYPDTAAEYLLAEADWVFITASSIPNKTFPRLAELSGHAVSVLMGPTTPWLPQLARWGIDFLAGTIVRDELLLRRVVAEGGGKAIFDKAVSYVVADIGTARMQQVKEQIAALAEQRDELKQQMNAWYAAGHSKRFPLLSELEALLGELSGLDTLYKQMWDVRQHPEVRR